MNIKNFAIILCCFIFSLQGSENRKPINKKPILKEHSLKHQIKNVFIPGILEGSVLASIPAAKKALNAYAKQNICNKETLRKCLPSNMKVFGKTFAIAFIPTTGVCILLNRYNQIKSEMEFVSKD